MEKIFENAKFGDKFKTRDGRIAIYACKAVDGLHNLVPECSSFTYGYNDDGTLCSKVDAGFDIVEKCAPYAIVSQECLEALAEENYPYPDDDAEIKQKAFIEGALLAVEKFTRPYNKVINVEWTDFNKVLTDDSFREITGVSDNAILVLRKTGGTNKIIALLNSHNTKNGKTWTINEKMYYEYFNWSSVVKYCPLCFSEQTS